MIEERNWLRANGLMDLDEYVARMGEGLSETAELSDARLDSNAKSIKILVKGRDGDTPVWSRKLRLNPKEKTAFNGEVIVNSDYQHEGIGRKLLKNSANICCDFGIDEMKFTFQSAGAYFGARCGFLPEKSSWDQLRHRILNSFASLPLDSWLTKDIGLARIALTSNDPRNIWTLSSLCGYLKNNWPGDHATFNATEGNKTLGCALLSQPSFSWGGSLYLNVTPNPSSEDGKEAGLAIFNQYVGRA